METVDAVECMVAIMFDGLLDEIDRFSVEAPTRASEWRARPSAPEEWQSAGTLRQERRCLDLHRGDRGHHGHCLSG
jgi:hypothetical protein